MLKDEMSQAAARPTVDVVTRTTSTQHDNTRSDAGVDTMTAFFERSGMCMARLDAGLQIREANQEFCHQFGLSASAVQGVSIFTLVHAASHESLRHQFARALNGRHIRITERVVGLRQGHTAFPCRLTAVVIDNACEGCLVVRFEPDHPTTTGTTDARLLTALDARILEGIASGVSTIDLAATCYLSRQGVEYRVGMMLRRMRVPNRVALVSKAYSMGVLSVGVWPPHVLSECVDQQSGQHGRSRPLDLRPTGDQESGTSGRHGYQAGALSSAGPRGRVTDRLHGAQGR